MIGVKEAVRKARDYAQEVLGQDGTVEEIERESYRDRDAWRITLGFEIPLRFSASPQKEYKSFFIDAETGEALAMRIRELAA